jgi:carbon monoxide dehydrogenase subunit G
VPQEYQQSQTIDAPPEEVFAWLSDVGNLPEYLPPVVASSAEGPSVESVSGQRIRATLEYPGEEGRTFHAEGYLAVDERERRMEWGAEAGRDYSGRCKSGCPRAATPLPRASRRRWSLSAGR